MNILTFDIEEWYIEKAKGSNSVNRYAEFDSYLDRILDILDEKSLKGTFFCVGAMGREFPKVIRKIEQRGHEIGCHSDKHVWLNKMSYTEVLEDTKLAVDSLEQCVGKKVLSYRAPAFSIGKSNKWAFEILGECGIVRDASIFPTERDFGGFADFGYKEPVIIDYEGVKIKEFPICTASFFGKEIAYSGGGYFRFFPLSFIKKEMAKHDYAMTYFHINDLLPELKGIMTREAYESYFRESGNFMNRYKRYIKSNLGKKKAMDKLMKLILSSSFINLEQADATIGWDNISTVFFEK